MGLNKHCKRLFIMSIEDTFYSYATYLSNSFRVWTLIALNYSTWAWETGYEFTRKSVKGILDAHTSKEWVFLSRNTAPWSTTTLSDNYPMIYNPSENLFSFNTCDIVASKGSFGDVVTAELKQDDIIYDLSSFFHKVKWYTSSNAAPSLYEMSLVYCLSNNLIYTKEKLEKFSLNVLTADGKNIKQPLTKCYDEFNGWNLYEETLSEPIEPAA